MKFAKKTVNKQPWNDDDLAHSNLGNKNVAFYLLLKSMTV